MSIALQILGSNSAAFAHGRHQTSQVLKIQDQYVLIDCGEGTQLLMRKHQVKISKINIIVISHLHGDHYYGLIGLLSTLHLFGRKKDLMLIGPPGLSDVISLQLKYSETSLNFKINFTEWEPGETRLVVDHPKFTITTIPLEHRVPCSGYLFQEKPKKRRIDKTRLPDKLPPSEIYKLKCGEDLTDEAGNILHKNEDVTLDPLRALSYAFCSDTRYKPELITNIQGVDMLYHEATFTSEMEERAKNTYHSTARQAATLAKDAQVGRLLIGHFSTRYRNLEPVLKEALEVFEKTEIAAEGHIFEIDEQ
ncbi:MAG: ribonuclease Z [Cytophagales bacterium]|nr:ribonuclease Z [Cytophagales bacterium]